MEESKSEVLLRALSIKVLLLEGGVGSLIMGTSLAEAGAAICDALSEGAIMEVWGPTVSGGVMLVMSASSSKALFNAAAPGISGIGELVLVPYILAGDLALIPWSFLEVEGPEDVDVESCRVSESAEEGGYAVGSDIEDEGGAGAIMLRWLTGMNPILGTKPPSPYLS